ncbi:MAG: hypothetical protein ACYDB7_11165, partial [Mycobacteriales bacterium]
MTSLLDRPASPAPRPVSARPGSLARARWEQVALGAFIVLPLAALGAAPPLLWNRWVSWRDVVLLIVFYAVSG